MLKIASLLVSQFGSLPSDYSTYIGLGGGGGKAIFCVMFPRQVFLLGWFSLFVSFLRKRVLEETLMELDVVRDVWKDAMD